MEKHTAIYVRVSTRQQDTRSQLPDLRRWLDAYATDDRIVWYRDKFTGKTMDRPGWRKLETAINNGRVSRVVVWRLVIETKPAACCPDRVNTTVTIKKPVRVSRCRRGRPQRSTGCGLYRVAGEHVLDISQQQLLVLLLVIESKRNNRQSVVIE